MRAVAFEVRSLPFQPLPRALSMSMSMSTKEPPPPKLSSKGRMVTAAHQPRKVRALVEIMVELFG